MADELEDVIEQARQKLVQIVRTMMRFMDSRSRNDSRFFRSMVERQAPGMQRMIDQGRSDAEISGTLGEALRPGWEGNLTQAFSLMDDNHRVFQDPAVRQATSEYLAMRPQLMQRAGQMTTQLQELGAPSAAVEFQRITQDADARIAAAAPSGRPTTPATRAPGGLPTPPRSTQAPTGPGDLQAPPPPTQTPRITQASLSVTETTAFGGRGETRVFRDLTATPARTPAPITPTPPTPQPPTPQPPAAPQARAGQQVGPAGPGAQPTPPPTRPPGVGGPATPPPPRAPGTSRAPGAGPTPPRTQATGPGTGAPPPRTQATGPGQGPGTGAPPPGQAAGTGQGAGAVRDAQPASAQVGDGTSRTFTSATSGPVKLDAELLGAGGRVVVRADPNCTQARITIRTADQTGPAADAVRNATLDSSPDGRVTASAHQTQPGLPIVQGAGNIVGDGYVVHNGNVVSSYYSNDGSGISVISHSGSGSIITGGRIGNLNVGNGNVHIDSIEGGAFTIMQGTAPIEIEAIVPEGSSVECSTDSANLETHGKVDVVEAETASGNVSVEQASEVRAGTASGNVSVEQATDVQARTASGNVNVDKATDVRATTASGNVRVDRADQVVANTASGDVRVQNAIDIRAGTASGDVNVHLGETVRATTASGDVSVGYAEDLQTRTGSGDVSVRNADKVVARSDSGAVDIGTTKDATARSRRGNITVRDAQGIVQAHSGTGSVQVRATGGGSVTAGSVTGAVNVTASDRAISEGLTVKAEGPPGRVSTPEGANTGTGAAAGSNGARDFNSTSRADRARDTGTARD